MKTKRATDDLNIALSGVEACLSIMGKLTHPEAKDVQSQIKAARQYCELAREALLTITFHRAQI